MKGLPFGYRHVPSRSIHVWWTAPASSTRLPFSMVIFQWCDLNELDSTHCNFQCLVECNISSAIVNGFLSNKVVGSIIANDGYMHSMDCDCSFQARSFGLHVTMSQEAWQSLRSAQQSQYGCVLWVHSGEFIPKCARFCSAQECCIEASPVI